jgi:hypothetical protein
VSNSTLLPECCEVDYASILESFRSSAKGPTSLAALHALSDHWMKAYKRLVDRPTSIYEIPEGGFHYLFDCEGSDHCDGQGPQPARTMPRVVAAYGTSNVPAQGRRKEDGRMRGWLGPTHEVLGDGWDKGHFVAHSMGGAVDRVEINVFAHRRALNRGWSAPGKLFRKMENWCAAHPGTTFFHRPLYAQESDVPDWLEFGIIHSDLSTWCEVFDNRAGVSGS